MMLVSPWLDRSATWSICREPLSHVTHNRPTAHPSHTPHPSYFAVYPPTACQPLVVHLVVAHEFLVQFEPVLGARVLTIGGEHHRCVFLLLERQLCVAGVGGAPSESAAYASATPPPRAAAARGRINAAYR